MAETTPDRERIPVYMMPGMAAAPTIFEYIDLPADRFETIWLEWKIPEPGESLSHYALRMCKEIHHERPVLLGVSFGGVLVQEMAKHIRVRKIIVISSVKCRAELPYRMRMARNTGAHKLIPTGMVDSFESWARYAFGAPVVKRIDLYRRYLSVRDKDYLDWAINCMVHWDQEEPLPHTVHIQGDRDVVFPAYRIKDCIWVKGGTHVMIVNRFRWFNEHLPALITLD